MYFAANLMFTLSTNKYEDWYMTFMYLVSISVLIGITVISNSVIHKNAWV